jgi:trans-aconitate methyltransferase
VFRNCRAPKDQIYVRDYDRRFGFVTELGRSVLELLQPIKSGELILDLGCGIGHLTSLISSMGASVLGIDLSRVMLSEAKKSHPCIEFIVADGQSFKMNYHVDAVFSNAALHWMRDADGVLRAVYEVLKSGGRFVAEFGAEGNLSRIIESLFAALNAKGYDKKSVDFSWFFPSVGQYERMLVKHGFEVRCLEAFDRPTLLDDRPDALTEWIHAFASAFLVPVRPEERDFVVRDAVERARPRLHKQGRWFVDYKRLRFVAIKRERK